jgi:hypothetical protein
MNFDFGDVLTRAGRITWQNKGLWILGILAALGSRGGVDFNYRSNFPSDFTPGPGGQPPENFPDLDRLQRLLENNLPTLIGVVVAVICVVLLINIIFWVLSMIGRGGLIGGARRAQASGQVSFSESWNEGTRNLGRVFSIWLITDLPLIIIGVVFAVIAIIVAFGALSGMSSDRLNPRDFFQAMGLGLACLIPFICLLVVAGIVMAILNHMGTLAAVVEERSGLDAIRRGWDVLRSNAITLVILGAILIILNVVFGFVISLPIILAVLPVIVGVAAGAMNDSQALIGGGVLFALLCCVAYLPILLVLRGVFETWSLTSWTLAYERLTGASTVPGTPSTLPPSPQPTPLA